jgi:hypothetical protein
MSSWIFEVIYSSNKVLWLDWTFIMEVGMVSWCVLNKHILFKESSKQAKLEENFKSIWCHSNIFASKENFTIWRFLLLMYVLSFVHL